MRRFTSDLSIIALLFALPLLMFWQQTVGGRTLLPTENLYQFEPYATYREVVGAPAVPHNALLSDLVLQNYQWKTFIRENLAAGELPLWNPYQFAGIPFMAAGQQSTLYPLSVIYYVMPLTAAYGWFTVAQLWLAGVFMYLFVRGLGAGRFGAALAAVVWQLSAFFVTNAVFPMMMGAAAWLPLLLLTIDNVIRRRPLWRGRAATLPWVALGAVALGCNVLAGHVEITYYTLLIAAYYAAGRLLVLLWQGRRDGAAGLSLRAAGGRALALLALVALGLGLGAVQFVPLYELVSRNFRDGSATLEQVLGWAHPARGLVQFVMPNVYGSPAHHAYFDLFTGQWTPATVNALGQPSTTIDWGIKNYVEGALYVGILPLALAAYALLRAVHVRRGGGVAEAYHGQGYHPLFALLGAMALTFMFGLPTYALLYYGLPGINQLHSPFRWVFALTLCVAVLAGLGADGLVKRVITTDQTARRFGFGLLVAGILVLVALGLSRLMFAPLEPLIERLLRNLALAERAFADARMFYSYQFGNVLVLGLMLAGAGLVFLLAARRGLVWQAGALALVAADLMIASWGFNPASDPLLLDFTPPAVQWLQSRPGEWRYTTLDRSDRPPLFNANMTMRYDLDDVRGYESMIPRQYVEYMQALAPQVQLEFNRVAPLYTGPEYNHFGGYHATLDSPLFDLLNVRYVITHKDTLIAFQEWELVYTDEAVAIWQNDSALPRAYLVPQDDTTLFADPSTLFTPVKPRPTVAEFTPARIETSGLREKQIGVTVAAPSYLVVSELYFPGWRAYIRPVGAGEDAEQPLAVERVQGNFQGVRLNETGEWVVRLVYSPQSFQIGAFGSFLSAVVVALLLGVWAWRGAMAAPDAESGVMRVARNSVAPILLNLFNRGIDFAFAAVMLRILGAEAAGIYYYAVVVFGWFDILTNFGLNLYLTREVARDRASARRLFANTSALRLLLTGFAVPLLLLFLAARQSAVSPPLPAEALLALGLLYLGLLPGTLSTGLTALYYAFERAEVPALVATLATLCKAVFGLAALLLGWGVVGLAGVSIATNIITLALLWGGGRAMLRGARSEAAVQPRLMRRMAGESWPLMLNHFLASIFFQIDVVLIEAIHNTRMVGQYSVAYKWVLALNIIPAFFTQALLPVMSRQAHEDRAALRRTYILAIKLLTCVSLPTAILFTFLAYGLTGLLGGAEFLPDGAIALQLMIWSIPIGWINSLTQYVLIALDMQRRITGAFIVGVGFNLITNLIFIPAYGYRAAALTTIASELALLVPFALLLHQGVGRLPWVAMLWRPVAAALVMLGLCALLSPAAPLLAPLLGVVAYLVALRALRPLDDDEISRLLPLLPGRLRAALALS